MSEILKVLNRKSSDTVELATIKDIDELFKKSDKYINSADREIAILQKINKEREVVIDKEKKLELELEKIEKENNSLSMTWGNSMSSVKGVRTLIGNSLKEYSKAYNDVKTKANQLGVDLDLAKHEKKINELNKAWLETKKYM